MIKSFRGLIADEAIETIALHTNTGTTGYRIMKFQLMPHNPGSEHAEHVVKIFSIPQTAATNVVDFSDNTLLAVAYLQDNSDKAYPQSVEVIFDNVKFNQDIYITMNTTSGSASCNYYIELETIGLNLTENTVATLKDIRNIIRDE